MDQRKRVHGLIATGNTAIFLFEFLTQENGIVEIATIN